MSKKKTIEQHRVELTEKIRAHGIDYLRDSAASAKYDVALRRDPVLYNAWAAYIDAAICVEKVLGLK